MPNLQVKDPAERLELTYIHADGNEDKIRELGEKARAIVPGVPGRCAMVHVVDLPVLVPILSGSGVRPEVVIDFPDGCGGWRTKGTQAFYAAQCGAVGGDVVVNLRYVWERNKKKILDECARVKQYLPEIKLIGQIPYLWQKDPNGLFWLLDILPSAGVYCIKDWTTRQNFSVEPNIGILTRIRYIEAMAEYIEKNKLGLLIKVAGQVFSTNAPDFVRAGADLLGISYGKAEAVREALLSPQ